MLDCSISNADIWFSIGSSLISDLSFDFLEEEEEDDEEDEEELEDFFDSGTNSSIFSSSSSGGFSCYTTSNILVSPLWGSNTVSAC